MNTTTTSDAPTQAPTAKRRRPKALLALEPSTATRHGIRTILYDMTATSVGNAFVALLFAASGPVAVIRGDTPRPTAARA